MTQSTEPRLNGRKPGLELTYHLYYPAVCCLECITEFAKRENLAIREFKVLVLRTEHDVCKLERSFNLESQLFFRSWNCYRWKIYFAFQSKKKKPVVIAKWETRAKMRTKTLSTEVLIFFWVKYEKCRPLRITGK